jgi:hypothetical protein
MDGWIDRTEYLNTIYKTNTTTENLLVPPQRTFIELATALAAEMSPSAHIGSTW